MRRFQFFPSWSWLVPLSLGLLALSGSLDSANSPLARPAQALLPDMTLAALTATELPLSDAEMTRVTAPVDGQIVTSLPHAGDVVHRGQVLAVIWSLEVGERKSRLLAAASRLMSDEEQLVSLCQRGADDTEVQAAERHCELDRESLARAERELRGLTLEGYEIAAIRQCAARLYEHTDAVATSHWAELELRAPSDGVLVQAPAVGGDAVRPGTLLFTISAR